jgi:hypothetical protein
VRKSGLEYQKIFKKIKNFKQLSKYNLLKTKNNNILNFFKHLSQKNILKIFNLKLRNNHKLWRKLQYNSNKIILIIWTRRLL